MMYFITEPGFCQHFFGNIFEIPEKERLFIHFSFIFYASALLCEGLGDAEAGGRGGKTALTGLPEVGGEEAAHAAHGVDDLITGDGVVHPGKGHIRTGDGVHGADDVPLDAGNFHEAGHGVADEAQQVAQSHCGGSGALLGRAALEVAESGGGHRAGSAHLGLTAALRARESGAGRDDLTEPGGDIEGVADGLFVGLAAAGQRQQNSGQDAAAARRGGSDDALHAGVALGGLESFGSHCGEVIAAKALSFLMGLLHPGCIAARKAASAALGRVIVPAGGLHHLPEVVHHLPAVGLGEAALG